MIKIDRWFIVAAFGVCTSLTGCAALPDSKISTVSVPGAPKASGPYSQATISNGFVFTAGIVPRDPATNDVIKGDITAQSRRVFDSLEAILKDAGCSFKDVVKANVYLTDLADFAAMNLVYAEKFGDSRPARTTVQAKLPAAGALVEIDMVARVPK